MNASSRLFQPASVPPKSPFEDAGPKEPTSAEPTSQEQTPQESPSPVQPAKGQSSEVLTEDAAYIARCGQGDLQAFDILVERHQDRIFSLCYWMLGNREDAADAAQDAFVRAYRSLGNFRGDSAFGTWLHRITVNVCIDFSQRRKRAPLPYCDLNTGEHGEERDLEASTQANGDGREDDPARLAFRHERRAAVREALARLPEHYRMALVLFDIEGHSYEEISHTLSLPLGTVKSRISRARGVLREELAGVRELFEA